MNNSIDTRNGTTEQIEKTVYIILTEQEDVELIGLAASAGLSEEAYIKGKLFGFKKKLLDIWEEFPDAVAIARDDRFIGGWYWFGEIPEIQAVGCWFFTSAIGDEFDSSLYVQTANWDGPWDESLMLQPEVTQ